MGVISSGIGEQCPAINDRAELVGTTRGSEG
jgi:hypothetical protein